MLSLDERNTEANCEIYFLLSFDSVPNTLTAVCFILAYCITDLALVQKPQCYLSN